MSAERVARVVAAGESETLEFKSTTGTRREATQTVCAMLNQRGGQVLFGVTPDGRVAGQQVSDRTVEELSRELMRIDPPAFPTIERISVGEGREVVAVTVSRGPAGPYMYRGSAYRRAGNTTVVTHAEEYRRLLLERMHKERRWENQPAEGWSIGDLDERQIRLTAEEAMRRGRLEDPGTRDTGELLRGLGLIRDGVLWRAAAVLFGSEERLRFDMPQCLLRVARIRGVARMEFLDNRQFRGNAFVLLSAAERFLRDSLPIAGRFESGRMDRIDEPLVPPLATREALVNALCHRDYSVGGGSIGVALYDDRLEVTSTGNLPFGLTPEKLFVPHESLPWNPIIAETFYRRGVIERWGSGTLKMAATAVEAGLPRPEIVDDETCVTVRFRHRGFFATHTGTMRSTGRAVIERRDLNEQLRGIVDLLGRAGRPLSLREVHQGLPARLTVRQVQRTLARLRDLGLVAASGRGASARWSLSRATAL